MDDDDIKEESPILPDQELEALDTAVEALRFLTSKEQARVVGYLYDRFSESS